MKNPWPCQWKEDPAAPQIHIYLSQQSDQEAPSIWALRADCPQVGNRAVNCTKGRQDIWDILRCFSSLQHGWLIGVTPWASSAKLLRAHGSLCPPPGARQPGPPSIPVAHQQDPHLLRVACNAPETLRQNKYFCFFHSGACNAATNAPLYSVKRKARVACLAPQHKHTWNVLGWRLHYPA